MADLPSITLRAPANATPTPGVSPGQIAEPFNEFAATLATAGKAAEDVARPLAHKAGIEAVTRDDEGNLQVKRLPIIGPAADDFESAVKWSALTQTTAEARRKDLALSREFQNDPDGYLKAADNFKKEYVTSVTKSVGAEVGLALGKAIDGTTTQQYNSLLAQKQALIRHNFDRDTTALIKDAQVDLESLIESGGLDTAAGRKQANQLIDRVVGTYRARSGNPILSAPPAETGIEIKKFDQNVGASVFAAGVKKILQDNPEDGLDKAQAAIDENFNNQSIPASQRVANRDRAQDTIKDFTQDRAKTAIMAARLQKQKDDLFESAVIRSTVEGGKPITETEIKKADASTAAIMRMISWVKRDGLPEPLAHISERASQDVFRRIHLPEGDPNKITDPSQIRDLYAPQDGGPGVLKRSDEQWLEKVLTEARSPAGESINRERKLFLDNHAQVLVPGDPRVFIAIKEMQRQEDMLRSQGKDPHSIYDPASPMYFGKPENINKYKRKLDDILKDYQNQNLTGPGKDTVSTAIVDIPPGMSPAEAIKQFKSGTRVRLPDGKIGTVP